MVFYSSIQAIKKLIKFFTSINRTMKHTSLQNIISNQRFRLEQSDINKLFQKHRYPSFELPDLRKPELMKKDTYASFLGILQEWNKNVANPAKQINQCDYRQNQFIFSWLKWVAVQSNKQIDPSLVSLKTWYNKFRKKQPKICIRKQNMMNSYAQEWQIRSSYKSNLPLEINNYNRRALFQIKTAVNSPQAGSQKENGKIGEARAIQLTGAAKFNKQQNSYLRQMREQREMDDYLCNFRKSKVHFYKKSTKNYYKREFFRDKLEVQYPKISEKFTQDSQTKDFRIKTSTQGFRQLPQGASLFMNQTQMLPFYRKKKVTADKQADNSTTEAESKSLNISNIDGLGLLINPFELKIKKKKRS